MAGSNQQYSLQNDVWHIMCEFTITAAGAIVPNSDGTTSTDPLISAVRTGVGTYLLTMPGNFQKVLARRVLFNAAAASSQQAQITAIGLGTGTPTAGGESTTTVTVITGNSNAVPAAADQASGVVSVFLSLQKHKL